MRDYESLPLHFIEIKTCFIWREIEEIESDNS